VDENTRESEDGFNGAYPSSDGDWAERAYRDAGMEPPWTLHYEDGKVVGPATPPDGDAAPPHRV